MESGAEMIAGLYTYAATALIAGALAAGGAWQVQGWRYASKIAAQEKAEAAAQIRQAERMIQNGVTKNEANEKRIRAIVSNAMAADRARNESERLRSASEQSLAGARADHAACVVSSATHAKLLDHCERSYRGMAQTADGHATDAKTLIEAWPAK